MKLNYFLSFFLAVVGVVVCFVNYDLSDSDEDYDIINNCLNETGCPLTPVHSLNRTIWKKIRSKLNLKVKNCRKNLRRVDRAYGKKLENLTKLYEDCVELLKNINSTHHIKEVLINITHKEHQREINQTYNLKLEKLNITHKAHQCEVNQTYNWKLEKLNITHKAHQREVNQTYNWKLKELNETYVNERKTRLYFQSFVDMDRNIHQLFRHCWPKWAPNKPSKNYTDAEWKILLNNIENPRILALRKNLLRSQINAESFIQLANDIITLRNEKFHERVMDGALKKEAIQYWNVTHDGQPIVQAVKLLLIQIQPKLGSDPGNAIETTSGEKVKTEVTEDRKNLNVLEISHFREPENHFDKELKTYFGGKHTCLVVLDEIDTAYVIYKNFEDAYDVWNKRVHGDFQIAMDQQPVIIDGRLPFEKDQPAFVKVTIDEKKFREADQIIMEKVDRDSKPYRVKIFEKSNQKKNQVISAEKIQIFYEFGRCASALKFYLICKNAKIEGEVNLLKKYLNHKKDLKMYEGPASSDEKKNAVHWPC